MDGAGGRDTARLFSRRFGLAMMLPVCALAITTCGYFNALYNAQRSFDAARRAELSGEQSRAVTSYTAAIQDAASSYRSHQDGRWADDALMLIGRARFALREYDASRAAFLTLLIDKPESGLSVDAHAWLGASEAALGNPAVAAAHLDSALSAGPDREAEALARLWRARIRLEHGTGDPWPDLDGSAASGTVFAPEANLMLAGQAIAAGDSVRTRVAFDRLLRDRNAARWTDSITVLINATNTRFGSTFTRSAIEPVSHGDWPASIREPHLLHRARLAADAGDTELAIEDALHVAANATPANRASARVAAARYRLREVSDTEQLDDVRSMLLPVVANPEARQLVRRLRAIEVLVNRAVNGGQPLALFVAAEWARDILNARALARHLFLTYADVGSAEVWAPKALLAAAELGDAAVKADVADRLEQYPDNPYAGAVMTGAPDAAAFENAERRLLRSLSAIGESALLETDAQDVTVRMVVGRLDSIRIAALADSTRIACGVLIDSLSLTGIRSDSARAACLRSDSVRLAEVLQIDTMMLVDTTAMSDTSRVGRGREGRSPFGRSNR